MNLPRRLIRLRSRQLRKQYADTIFRAVISRGFGGSFCFCIRAHFLKPQNLCISHKGKNPILFRVRVQDLLFSFLFWFPIRLV
jgi:hypothetical protein